MTDAGAKRSRVIIVGPTESVLTQRGNRHPSLASFLVGHGKSVTYISSNFYHATKTFFSKKEVEQAAETVPYKLIVFKTIGYSRNVSSRRVIHNLLFSIRVFLWLIFRASKDDTIILPSRPVELIFMLGLLRKLKKCRVILDIQDVWPDALLIEDKRKKRLFEKYCNFYLKPSLKWIDSFVHVAPSFVDWLTRYSPAAESQFLPLGYDAARWEAAKMPGPEGLGDPVELVCVGLLQHQIDVMPVLKALVGRSGFRLTIIGDDGAGERYEEVARFIEKHKLHNVSLLGRVLPNDMPGHLTRMDIGIVPMISSSIPNKVFDYIAACLPILVLGDNDSGWLVESEGIGWVVSYDEEGVATFLDDLNSDDHAVKLGRLMKCRGDFDRESLFSTILDMINPTLKEHS